MLSLFILSTYMRNLLVLFVILFSSVSSTLAQKVILKNEYITITKRSKVNIKRNKAFSGRLVLDFRISQGYHLHITGKKDSKIKFALPSSVSKEGEYTFSNVQNMRNHFKGINNSFISFNSRFVQRLKFSRGDDFSFKLKMKLYIYPQGGGKPNVIKLKQSFTKDDLFM